MHALVRTVFSKLSTLDPEEEEAKLQSTADDDANEGELRMTVTTKDEPLSENRHSSEMPQKDHDQQEAVDEILPSQTPTSLTSRPECEHILIRLYFSSSSGFRRSSINLRITACSRQRLRSE